MAKTSSETSAADGPADIDALKKRFDALNTKKIQAETNKDAAEKRLTELKERARREFGTDDIDALKQKLADLTADNQRKRAEYQTHLNEIETKLAEVESKHSAAGK